MKRAKSILSKTELGQILIRLRKIFPDTVTLDFIVKKLSEGELFTALARAYHVGLEEGEANGKKIIAGNRKSKYDATELFAVLDRCFAGKICNAEMQRQLRSIGVSKNHAEVYGKNWPFRERKPYKHSVEHGKRS